MHSGMGEGGECLNPPRLGGGENFVIGIGGTREKKVIIYLVVVEHFSPIFCISNLFSACLETFSGFLVQRYWESGFGVSLVRCQASLFSIRGDEPFT